MAWRGSEEAKPKTFSSSVFAFPLQVALKKENAARHYSTNSSRCFQQTRGPCSNLARRRHAGERASLLSFIGISIELHWDLYWALHWILHLQFKWESIASIGAMGRHSRFCYAERCNENRLEKTLQAFQRESIATLSIECLRAVHSPEWDDISKCIRTSCQVEFASLTHHCNLRLPAQRCESLDGVQGA